MIDKIFAGISKIMGSKSERDIKKIQPIVDEIKSFEEEMKNLSDVELKAKTEEFRNEIREATAETQKKIDEIKNELNIIHTGDSGEIDKRSELESELEALDKEWLDIAEEVLDDILPEAFAVLKETCRRFVGKSWKVAGTDTQWNMIPYDVQLIGAVVLHQGKIAEMKTGEGKTLVAIFPTYLNALVGRGVHIVTVNSYLAQRDAEWNEPIFNFHGLRVDCVDRYEPNSEERRRAYRADITYGTNNEFGFDYLRDNMVVSKDQLVQRRHHFTIVDEVDSVLIDEARTPLIISGPVPQDNQNQKYSELKPRVQRLVESQKNLIAKFLHEAEEALEQGDEQKAGLALFRARRGFPKSKKFMKMMQEPRLQKLTQQTEYLYLQDQGKNMHLVDEAMYYAERSERIHAVNQLLKAYTLYEKDKEYIVEEDKVMIVDEHTGRVLSGRRYSDGLHQAIEAKEQVKVQQATQTYATITLQNYFRMYHKLAGMTGTAETEAEEFGKIYGMDVSIIPTNRPIARDDNEDLVYKTKREKYTLFSTACGSTTRWGSRCWSGTTSVEVSETISRMFKRAKIPHNVLNAKRDRAKDEAQVVAEAGRKRGGHHRDQHGRPRHRHQAGRGRQGSWAGWPSSAPSGTSRAASTCSSAVVPAARGIPARASSTSRSRTTSCACSGTSARPRSWTASG
jgi:preprotein translocase subunit SecA